MTLGEKNPRVRTSREAREEAYVIVQYEDDCGRGQRTDTFKSRKEKFPLTLGALVHRHLRPTYWIPRDFKSQARHLRCDLG